LVCCVYLILYLVSGKNAIDSAEFPYWLRKIDLHIANKGIYGIIIENIYNKLYG